MEDPRVPNPCPTDDADILEYYYLAAPSDAPTDTTDPEASASSLEGACQDGEHGPHGDLILSTFPQALSDAPFTPEAGATPPMPPPSDNRSCAIMRRAASRSLSSGQNVPRSGKTLLYSPTEFEWQLIGAMDSGPLSEFANEIVGTDNVDGLGPLGPNTPLLRRKGHIRRASEPLTSTQRDPNTPPMLPAFELPSEDIDVNLAPELTLNSPEPSPRSPSFTFPQTPLDGSPIPDVDRRIFVQILGASGLPQTGVLKRSPKPYADISIGGQGFRTSTVERRSTAPVWNSNFLFESIMDTDSVVIRVWNEAGPNAQRAWLGSFMCTVRRMLLMQAVNNVLTFTLDRWPNEGHLLDSTPCGSIHVCIRDLTSPPLRATTPTPLIQVNNIPRIGADSSRHHKYLSTSLNLHPRDSTENSMRTRPSTPLLIIPNAEQRSNIPSPRPPPKPAMNSNIHPNWVGAIVGRTLSLSRNNYPWVPTGDIDIKAGPVCAGGHCDIYMGELRREGAVTQVALKQLRVFTNASDNMKKMFCREVQFWSRLRHPNVLPFWGCYELDEYRLFMVSPWASNGNSLQYVQKNPGVDRRRILRQTAEALAYLHSGTDGNAVVHGDLKADNVLISENGDALLADFGLTRYVEKLASISGTPSGISPHGHIRFSSPELLCPASGEEPRPTPESDVFAFACFLIQLYSEELPFSDIKRDVQVLTEILRGNKPSRPQGVATERGLDDDIWTLANECWRPMAILRPSMDQIAERLR